MDDKQRLAIMTALGVLRKADIKAGLHKLWRANDSEMYISLPKVKAGSEERQKANRKENKRSE